MSLVQVHTLSQILGGLLLLIAVGRVTTWYYREAERLVSATLIAL
ncbi:MAG: hypothetical protein ABIJ81_00325 [Patescibacteria group bacterium]